jgi:hypothetical protein
MPKRVRSKRRRVKRKVRRLTHAAFLALPSVDEMKNAIDRGEYNPSSIIDGTELMQWSTLYLTKNIHELIPKLVEHGVDFSKKITTLLTDRGLGPSTFTYCDTTPLHFIVIDGNTDLLKAILKTTASTCINAIDGQNRSVLHVLFQYAFTCEAYNLLLNQGIDFLETLPRVLSSDNADLERKCRSEFMSRVKSLISISIPIKPLVLIVMDLLYTPRSTNNTTSYLYCRKLQN